MSVQTKLFIFTAPSGAGKTTIVRHLLEKYDFLEFSISATTRQKRQHEVDGRDYHFMTEETFKNHIKDGAFVEWEEVYPGQYYGTLTSEMNRIFDSGKCVVFDIDVKGAGNIKKHYKEDCMSIFIKPPSIDELVERLRNRNTETPESFERRIEKVHREMLFENQFDITLVNDRLDLALIEAEHIVETFVFGISV